MIIRNFADEKVTNKETQLKFLEVPVPKPHVQFTGEH